MNIKQILLICFTVLIIVMIFIIGGLVIRIRNLQDTTPQLPDTIINTIVIEKIKDDIKEKEQQLENYEYEYNKEKEYIKTLDDSSSIKLFFELTSD